MQTRLNDSKTTTIKDISVSIPKTIYSSKLPRTDLNVSNNFSTIETETGIIQEMLTQQHPLINTWLVLSSISICFLSALLFIMH